MPILYGSVIAAAVLYCTVFAEAHRYSCATMDANATPASFSADLLRCRALTQLHRRRGRGAVHRGAQRAGATIVQTVSHAFPETGLTCVLILRESHAVLHTWPETGTVNIDIFSCTHAAARAWRRSTSWAGRFGARHVSVQEIARADGHGPRSDPRA